MTTLEARRLRGDLLQAYRVLNKVDDIDPWFLEQISELVDEEKKLKKYGVPKTSEELSRIKSMGFSDDKIAELTKTTTNEVKKQRKQLGVLPVFKKVDTCAAEFKSETPYMYSTYQKLVGELSACEANPTNKEKIIKLSD